MGRSDAVSGGLDALKGIAVGQYIMDALLTGENAGSLPPKDVITNGPKVFLSERKREPSMVKLETT